MNPANLNHAQENEQNRILFSGNEDFCRNVCPFNYVSPGKGKPLILANELMKKKSVLICFSLLCSSPFLGNFCKLLIEFR